MATDGLADLDASAIVKLVVEEPAAPAAAHGPTQPDRSVPSAIALVEVNLAAARRSPALPSARIDKILAGLTLIPVDQPTLKVAAGLDRRGLRTLDAIHLATALSLGKDLESFIAYDRRLLEVAEADGVHTEQPR